eukprot:TRINITY_DN18084_c0_g1_i2.p1 TRINITY_DN18084_c0_g1~~TRINITY_DN18084_c0_g1_i2.p1  ORF type:complete len:133 (-),score=39.26 TRINITY_DN18084_c0_g1_i2:51-449(-)
MKKKVAMSDQRKTAQTKKSATAGHAGKSAALPTRKVVVGTKESAGSRRAAEAQAAALATAGPQRALDFGAGRSESDYINEDVDGVRTKLAALNPGFKFAQNHIFEQYPLVQSGVFCRLLYGDNRKLASIKFE